MAKETTIGEKSVKTRWRKRRVLHTNMYQSTRQNIGSLHPGMDIYGICFGQFSFINIIEYVIDQIKEPVDLDVSSWTIAMFEASRLAEMGSSVRRLRVMCDSSISSLSPSSFNYLVNSLEDDSIRLLRCHCKFAIIANETWDIFIRTSMNLNQNRRLENFEISDCKVLTTYMKSVVDDIFNAPLDLKGKMKLTDIVHQENTLDDLLSDLSGLDSLLGNR